MSESRHLIQSLTAVLEQGAALLGTLEAELYVRSPAPLATAPVGGHVRHCLDFVRAFLGGIEEGRIDYDLRERDPRLEAEPERAAAALRTFADSLGELTAGLDVHRTVHIRAEVPSDAGPEEGWQESTVGRELSVMASHTVHHYALIAMTLRHFGRDPGSDFGVAPSTLRFWREGGARKEQERCAPVAG